MFKKILCFIFCICTIVGVYSQNPLSERLVQKMIKDTSWLIASNIEGRELSYVNLEGKRVVVQVIKAHLKKNKLLLEAATPDNRDQFARQTVIDEMKAESAPGRDVVAGVNADFFNMKDGIPLGPVVKDHRIIKGVGKRMIAFVGVLKSGKVIMGDSSLFKKRRSKIVEALGARPILLNHGKLVPQSKNSLSIVHHPRTAFGITGRKTVFFVTVDGRQPEYSNGITLTDLAILMRQLGAKDAVNLDGGGSTTMVIKDSKKEEYRIQNIPSGKVLRPVANSWILIRKD